MRPEIRWLHRELPDWVGRGILTPEAADELRRIYPEPPPAARRNMALLVSSGLGASLVGSGIILLLAHNWDELPRSARAALALGLLLAAQALAAWVRFRRDSAIWREGSGTFLMLAAGAAIALVGQTYQLGGDLRTFLVVWLLVSAPIAYLMDAAGPALVYLAAMWFDTDRKDWYEFWLLAAVMAPYLYLSALRRPRSIRTGFLFGAMALSTSIGLALTVDEKGEALLLLEAALCAVFYLAARHPDDPPLDAWRAPVGGVGAAGITLLGFIGTLQGTWPTRHGGWTEVSWAGAYEIGAGVVLFAAYAFLVAARLRREAWSGLLYGAAPVVMLAGIGLRALTDSQSPSMVLSNLYVLGLGISTASAGIRSGRFRTVNAGLLIVAALVLLRFFDREVSFVVRGAAFITVGVGFLAANAWIVRRSREVPNA